METARETYASPKIAASHPTATVRLAAGAVPSVDDRRRAAKMALDLLDKHIKAGKMNYHFNSSGDVLASSAAGLAFLCAGSTLEGGPYQQSLKWCFAEAKNFKPDLQPTWGTGMAAIFLAELHRVGTTQQKPAVKQALERISGLLVKSQTNRGGWCHGYKDENNSLGYSDLMATTVLALQGLGMAKREGVAIPDANLQLGLKYIKDSSDESAGQIGYSPRNGQKGMRGPGRTAGGVLALRAMGQPGLPLTRAATQYVQKNYRISKPSDLMQDLNCGHASAQLSQMWAAWMAVETNTYNDFWAGQGTSILGRLQADGSFVPAPTDGKPQQASDSSEGGDMATAMHALMLALPDGHVSVSQSGGIASADTSFRSILAAARDAAKAMDKDAPESLAKLAALADAGEEVKDIAKKAKELLPEAVTAISAGGLPQDKKDTIMASLLTGGASATYTFKPSYSRAEIRLSTNPVLVDGLTCTAKPLFPEGATTNKTPGSQPVTVSTARGASTLFSEGTRSATAAAGAAAVELTWTWRKITFRQRIEAAAAAEEKK